MKVIKKFDGTEKMVSDQEGEIVGRLWASDSSQPIHLSDGAWINPKNIADIDEPEKIATWCGYPLSANGRSFMRDGERVYLEPHNLAEITYYTHPKYGTPLPALPPERDTSGEGTSPFAGELSDKMRLE